MGVNSGGAEGVLKGEHGLAGGAFEGELGDFVVIDKIDVGPEFSGDGGEFSRVLGERVDSVEHDVFEGDFAAGFFEIVFAGVDDLLDGDFFGPGNDLFAEGVVGGVQGDGEGDGELEIGEAFHLRGETDGGDG